MKSILFAIAIPVGISLSLLTAGQAQAYGLGSLQCSTSNVLGSSQCSGSYVLGNGENDVTSGGANDIASQILNTQDIFGVKDWTFGNKINVGGTNSTSTSTTGANTHGFKLSTGSSLTGGSFNFSNLDLSKNDVAVSLKSAKGFSLYYIKAGSVSNLSQINWNTSGTSVNNKGAAQGLSHISYYTRMIEVTPPPVKRVPEPASIAAITAVSALGVLARKKQRL
jgi:hypothetical protein